MVPETASNFATSDRWFHALMSRTGANREYVIAATSQGRVYPNGTDANDSSLLTAPMIFQELQNAGITWKIYVNPEGSGRSDPPTRTNRSCRSFQKTDVDSS
jgi:phospholipase C